MSADRRATRSVSRVASRRRSATTFRTSSPANRPRESFTSRKSSMSTQITATEASWCFARDRELEELLEHRATRQARELVVVGEERDLLLALLHLGDVDHHARGEDRDAALVADILASSWIQTRRPSFRYTR